MKSFKTKKGDEVFLDDKDFDYLIVKCGYTYCVARNKKGTIMCVCRAIPALLSDTGKQKLQLIHWDVMGHPGKGMVTDHEDGNPLNNQKDNLWICSQRKNRGNLRHKSATRNYSSKYPGVNWHKPSEKWRAQIIINKFNKHLGLFLNEEEAGQAYQNACGEIKLQK